MKLIAVFFCLFLVSNSYADKNIKKTASSRISVWTQRLKLNDSYYDQKKALIQSASHGQSFGKSQIHADELISLFQAAAEKNDDALSVYFLGRYLEEVQKWNDARKCFEWIIREDEGDISKEAKLRLIYVNLKGGNNKAALRLADQVANESRTQDEIVARFLRARALDQIGDSQDAYHEFEYVADTAESEDLEAEALWFLGNRNQKVNRKDRALHQFKRCAQTHSRLSSRCQSKVDEVTLEISEDDKKRWEELSSKADDVAERAQPDVQRVWESRMWEKQARRYMIDRLVYNVVTIAPVRNAARDLGRALTNP